MKRNIKLQILLNIVGNKQNSTSNQTKWTKWTEGKKNGNTDLFSFFFFSFVLFIHPSFLPKSKIQQHLQQPKKIKSSKSSSRFRIFYIFFLFYFVRVLRLYIFFVPLLLVHAMTTSLLFLQTSMGLEVCDGFVCFCYTAVGIFLCIIMCCSSALYIF